MNERAGRDLKRDIFDYDPQPRHTMAAGMLLAPMDLHAEHQTQRSDEVRVIVVTRPARLLRVMGKPEHRGASRNDSAAGAVDRQGRLPAVDRRDAGGQP